MPIIFASSLLLFPAMIFSGLYELFPNAVMGRSRTFLAPGERRVDLQCDPGRDDLLLLLLLDGDQLQSQEISENTQEHGRVHPRPSSWNAHGRITWKRSWSGSRSSGRFSCRSWRSCRRLCRRISPWRPMRTCRPFTAAPFLLIAVSVAFDLVQKIDSYLVMRNYKGLLQ